VMSRRGEGAPPLWHWSQVLSELAETVPQPDRQKPGGALAGMIDDEAPPAAARERNRLIARWMAEAARRDRW